MRKPKALVLVAFGAVMAIGLAPAPGLGDNGFQSSTSSTTTNNGGNTSNGGGKGLTCTTTTTTTNKPGNTVTGQSGTSSTSGGC
jgi:hypothetical protein